MSEFIAPVLLIMLLLVFAEAWLLQRTGRQNIDWRDVAFNINSGQVMLWLFRCLEVLCYERVLSDFSLRLFADVDPLWVWLFTLLAWDSAWYWAHRFHHKFRLLWAVHAVHHQGEHYNLSLGVRNSWYSVLTTIPFFLLLAVLGVPLSVFLLVSAVHYGVQFLNHCALAPDLGWLEKVFVTPTHHRIHHLNEKRYADMNFGGTFIVWDKLFGTFCRTPPTQHHAYGIKGLPCSCNPLRESHRLLLRQAGIRFFDNIRRVNEHSAPLAVAAGALLLFVLLVGYIQLYGYSIDNVTSEQAALFILLAAGSVGLGGISDGQRWGAGLWLVVTLALPVIFLHGWGWRDTFWLIVLPALALHGIAITAVLWLQGRNSKRDAV